MIDTRASGGTCPRGSDQTAQKDTTVAIMQLGKTHFGSRDGRKLQVQHDEGDVSSPIEHW